MTHPERLIVGLATVYGRPSIDDGTGWWPEDFAEWVASGMGVRMLLEHREPLDDAERLGQWFAFASVPEGSTPPGLLAIGEFAHTPMGNAQFANVRKSLEWFRPGGTVWGLSVTAADVSRPDREQGDGSKRWIKEVSLTTTPAFPEARVLGVGPYAADVWELLTGSPPLKVTSLAPRAVRRRLIAATATGKPIYETYEGDI